MDEHTRRTRLKGSWGEVPISEHIKRAEIEKLIDRTKRHPERVPETLAKLYGWHMDGRLSDDRFRRLVYEVRGWEWREREIIMRPGSTAELLLVRRILLATQLTAGSRQFLSELVVTMQISHQHALTIQDRLVPIMGGNDE